MKAAVYYSYGKPNVLTLSTVELPKIADNELLIRVRYTTVNRTDCGLRRANYVVSRFFTGLVRPKQPIGGSEFAGDIVAVGSAVTGFREGERVFGFDDTGGGAHAEYVAKKYESALAKIPDTIDYKTAAAATEGATYALNVLRAAHVSKGSEVMIYGASGAIGSAAVQLARQMGARVTAVCGTKTVARVKKLGANQVIDYQSQDFTQVPLTYDLVFDAVGKSSYKVCKKLLKPTGKYYSSELGVGAQNIWLALWFGFVGSKRVLFPIPKIQKQTIEYIADELRRGNYKPLIDREFSLDSIREASEYVERGQKIGNVVIRVD